jgi:predicted amidohydrolase YtcJ
MSRSDKADLVLRNGRVLTLDARFGIAEAVALQGDRVMATGSDVDLRALTGPRTQVVDLGGRSVTPGFNDSHHHFLNRAARAYYGIRLDQYRSVTEILDAVAAKAKQLGPGELILSNAGCAAELLAEGRTPTLAELDAAAPYNPVCLTFEDGRHVNSPLMALCNIDASTPEPPKGIIGRDENGALTGHFSGTAQRLLLAEGSSATGDIGVYSTEQLYTALKWAQAEANTAGLTSIRNPALQPKEMAAYQRLWQERGMSLRIAMDVNVDHVNLPLEELERELGSWGVRQPFGDEWLRLSGVGELWIDQSSDGMLNTWPYETVPLAGEGQPGYQGIQRLPAEKLNAIMVMLNRLGWRPLVHAGGDLAVDLLLDAFEAADRERPIAGKRWVVDHAHYGKPRHVERIKRMGLVVAMQYHPYMYYPVFASYHGVDQAQHLFPARDWLDEGIVVAGGSDYSKIPASPFEGIYFWTTRQTRQWGPIGMEHAVTREQALRMYTVNSAYMTYEDDIKGSLEPGKLADLAILEGDYLEASDTQLRDMQVAATLVGGRIVHQTDGVQMH